MTTGSLHPRVLIVDRVVIAAVLIASSNVSDSCGYLLQRRHKSRCDRFLELAPNSQRSAAKSEEQSYTLLETSGAEIMKY